MTERLEVPRDPNVHLDPMDPDDVVELPDGVPSMGSLRCMIYRHTVPKPVGSVDDNNEKGVGSDR